MSKPNAVGGLKWVKGEIDIGLQRVRRSLEEFAEGAGGAGEGDLADGITALHEIRGVLIALQLSGPARLVEEMQLHCEALAEGRAENREESAEALMLALIQLPDYLDRMESGQPDAPLALLPAINDLRGSRGEGLLSEAELLVPPSVLADTEMPSPEVQKALGRVAGKVRPHFHRYLLQWFKPETSREGLGNLGRLFHQLQRYINDGIFHELFLAAEALVEAMLEGSIPTNGETKGLIGHLDRVIKPFADNKGAWPESDAQDLLVALMSVIAKCDSSSYLVQELRQAYGLQLGEEEAAADLQTGAGREAMAVLVAEARKELLPVKDALDLYARGTRDDREGLTELEALVRNLGKTLKVTGRDDVVAPLERGADGIGALALDQAGVDASRLSEVAQELLAAEAALAELSRTDVGPEEDLSGRALAESALTEAVAEMKKVEQAIDAFANDPGDLRHIQDVPGWFSSVTGALRVIGEHDPAELLDTVVAHIRQRYLAPGRSPVPGELDLLAQAISAIELYMEGLTGGQAYSPDLIGNARRALDKLRALEPPRGWPSAVVPVSGDDTLTPTAPATEQKVPAVEEEAEPSGVDPEFLEIFLEEAQEEEQSVRDQFARWSQFEGDQAALTRLRRSFHTLKGSGGLVGARRLGDFARAVENLLNGVIDGSVPRTPVLLTCVEEAVTMLPALIAAEAEGSDFEVTDIVGRAQRLAGVEAEVAAEPVPESSAKVIPWPPAAAPAVSEEPAPPETEAELAEATELAALADADQDLLDIFHSESREHLKVLRAYLESASEGGAVPDEAVIRALHTLTGSASMTGIDSAAAATRALEYLFDVFRAHAVQASPAAVDLLSRTVEQLQLRCDRLPGGGDEIGALIALAAEADASITATEAEIESAELEARELPTAETAEEVPAGPAIVEEPVSGEIEAPSVVEEGELEEIEAIPAPPTPPPAVAEAPPVEPVVAAAAEAPGEELEPLPEDAELLGLFLEEARDILEKLDESVGELQRDPSDSTPIGAQKRLLHTLKGSARLSGLMAIGDLSHAFESLLTAVGQGQAQMDAGMLDLAQKTFDTLSDQVDAVEQRRPLRRAGPLIQALALALEGAPAAPAAEEPAEAVPAPPVEPVAAAPAVEPALPAEAAPPPIPAVEPAAVAPEPGPAAAAPAEAAAAQIRVRADLLNRLVNNAGEVSIYRSRLAQQNGVLGYRLEDLDQTVNRLREQLRQLEIETEAQIIHRYERDEDAAAGREDFDPLELDRFSTMQQLSRSLAETVNDLGSLRTILSDLHGESETLLLQQGRIADDLQDGLLRTRMVPFAQIVNRLQRLVRQTAQQLGKQARLEVTGSEVELDRGIQERVVAPLEHLLRNAVAHGVEPAEQRASAGKDATGLIGLAISREGNDVIISVADDGAGLDLAAVRARAVERGLLDADADAGDEEITQLIMESGFSTAREVTQIAGRGVGLDVVNAEIKQLSGNVAVESKAGQGTAFTIRLPLTLAILEAMLVQIGDEVYAIPHATIEGAARISRADLERNYLGDPKDFEYAGQDYRVMYLGSMLQSGGVPELGERSWFPVLLARAREHRVALHVDSLLGSERIVVKPLGPALSSIRWLSGGTILPDGRVAIILDMMGLLRSGLVKDYRPPLKEERGAERARRCVMIVDDSLTVRRVTSRMLRRQDMDVMAAKDGVDALAQLEDRVPDLILLDIEMPRMDGYELTRHIRRSARLRDIPLIMITSRTGQKHRDYAKELGVDRYLGKPYQETELLDEISAQLLEVGR